MPGCWACPSLEGGACRGRFRGASAPGLPVGWRDPGEAQSKMAGYVTAPWQPRASPCHLRVHAHLIGHVYHQVVALLSIAVLEDN